MSNIIEELLQLRDFAIKDWNANGGIDIEEEKLLDDLDGIILATHNLLNKF